MNPIPENAENLDPINMRPEICSLLVKRDCLGSLAHVAERVGQLEAEPGGPRRLTALVHDADGVAVAVDGWKKDSRNCQCNIKLNLQLITGSEVVFDRRAADALNLPLGPEEAPGGGNESLSLAGVVADGLLAPGDGQVTHGLVLRMVVVAQPLRQSGCGESTHLYLRPFCR